MKIAQLPRSSRQGSAIVMLMTVVGLLYIFGMMLINYMSQETTQTAKLGENLQAYYLAEACVDKAVVEVQKIFQAKLLSQDGEIDEKLLSLLDIDRAENFNFRVRIKDGEIIDGGSAEVLVEVNDLKLTPFKTYIDEYENVPPLLQIYRKKNKDTYSDKALGGWEGLLKFEAVGKYKNAEKKLELVRQLKVTDLTPPAENYTLFVESKKDEYLRKGEFRCRNWSIVRDLKSLIDKLVTVTGNAFQETLGHGASDLFWEPNMGNNINFDGDIKVRTLKIIRKLVMNASDIKVKDYVDNTIQKLHPYLWGKIRTNGRLHVYLPFFAADDIINYFEDNSIFSHQRPEIGYLFCNNQIHDPYLSKYTYYEGEIIRYYQKLKPYVLGITETPYPSSDAYTINTKFDFVARHSDRLKPLQLDRIKKKAKDFCHEYFEGTMKVNGTYGAPASLWGLKYVQGDVFIGGRYSGKSMIITEGNIYVTGDIEPDGLNSSLSLVALKGSVKFAKGVKKSTIKAAIYAKNSIVGGEELTIFGNLVVENLNRQKGDKGELIMPKKVMIEYDKNLKSEVGSNVCFNISEQIFSLRDI